MFSIWRGMISELRKRKNHKFWFHPQMLIKENICYCLHQSSQHRKNTKIKSIRNVRGGLYLQAAIQINIDNSVD